MPEPWRTDAPKILVVADDRDAGELLARLIDQAGWLADLAFSADAALEELVDADPPYVGVVLDLGPGAAMGPIQALNLIRHLPGPVSAVPVVAVSWDDGLRAQAWITGTDGWLTRPFHADRLVDELRAAIARPAGERDPHRQRQIGLTIPDQPA